MNELPAETCTCKECGRSFERTQEIGRRPSYCGRKCQQRAYRRRYVERMRAWESNRHKS